MDCQIDPNDEGPWEQIIETAGIGYLEGKALDNIHTASKVIRDAKTIHDIHNYDLLVKQTIALLTLARFKRGCHLINKTDKHVVVQTGSTLVEGHSSETIDTRKIIMGRGRFDPTLPPATEAALAAQGEAADGAQKDQHS